MEHTSIILHRALEAVYNERMKTYGGPSENHGRTADLWSAYLNAIAPYRAGSFLLTPTDVCILNILQKISRLTNGYHQDSVIDIAGYAENIALIEEHK